MEEFVHFSASIFKFLAYLAVALALAGAFVITYMQVTPFNEIELVQKGNMAAALSIVGAFLGFCAPLASTIAHSISILDVVIWAVVALIVQILVHFACRFLVPGLVRLIEQEGNVAAGALGGGLALGIGLLNAACLTY
jgi:putative membrane protein